MKRHCFTYYAATWGTRLSCDFAHLWLAKEALERARIKWSTQPGMVADMHITRRRHRYFPAGAQYDVLVGGKWIPESEAYHERTSKLSS